jgi:hypothetical protein
VSFDQLIEAPRQCGDIERTIDADTHRKGVAGAQLLEHPELRLSIRGKEGLIVRRCRHYPIEWRGWVQRQVYDSLCYLSDARVLEQDAKGRFNAMQTG